jgi:hypothetical protein
MDYQGNKNYLLVGLACTTLLISAFCQTATVSAESISFNVRDSTYTDKFVVMDTGKVGIGTNAPLFATHIVGNATNAAQIVSQYTGPGGVGGGGGILLYSNNGAALPLANDRLGYYLFGALNGSTYMNTAGLSSSAESNWTSTSYPTYLSLQTTGTTGGRTERVRISAAGNVGIGTATPGVYKLYVAGDVYTTGMWVSSDERLKKNITEIDSPLAKILKLKGHKYEFNRDKFEEKNLPEGTHYGVLAQELQEVLPEAVRVDEDGSESVSYSELIPFLIEAIKAQQKEINELKSRKF